MDLKFDEKLFKENLKPILSDEETRGLVLEQAICLKIKDASFLSTLLP